MPDWVATVVVAAAAAVQAVGAVVIVVLTIRLARIASDALRESARQAKAAETALEAGAEQLAEAARATLETRKQRLVASIPMLDLAVEFAVSTELETAGIFTVRNPGPSPAIDVRVLLYGMTSDRKAEEQPRHRSKAIALLAAGESQRVEVPMHDFRNIPNPRAPHEASLARFSNDWIRVVVYCQGIQGARTSLRYDWRANASPGADPDTPDLLELREVKILPDPQRTEWQIVLETEL